MTEEDMKVLATKIAEALNKAGFVADTNGEVAHEVMAAIDGNDFALVIELI